MKESDSVGKVEAEGRESMTEQMFPFLARRKQECLMLSASCESHLSHRREAMK